MAIRLYDYSLSGSCYKVRLMLGFLGLEYERVQMNFYPGRQHRSPEFREINPLGQIPVLEEDGLRLRDAQAILCHLANSHDASGEWLPRDAERFGPVMMWLMFAGGELMAASAARLHDALGYELDIEEARRKARAAFRVLDDHLTAREIAGARWIVGDTPTIADVACFPYVALAGDGGLGHEEYPALRNWMRDFRRLPRFRAMSGIPEFI
ncbi:glutathione S-transferase [Amaricoccus macauensis]|uniref:Glutathione S-transferase n=1 Tax=Amaricoccus macauensis TaxID=57001 RepID=A0A840SM05_9RHOB|nr:glutathione S-transferase [Amaricoccus macauensis]MBB5220391.1 glutathione S-transferase [Amaricoccus macauensis]